MKSPKSCRMGGRSLPDHLIFDRILPLLPVKSVTRFKTVCKTWYSAISAPDFVKSHLACSSSHSQFLVHGRTDHSLTSNSYFYLLPYRGCGKSLEDFVKLDCNITDIRTVGSCNGLVCLALTYTCDQGFLVLWNPATSESWKIDSPLHTCVTGASVFGYVSSIDDYKIAAFLVDKSAEDGRAFYYLYVYSLKVAGWKRIAFLNGDDVDGNMIRYFNSALIDDTVYWGTVHGRGELRGMRCIAFNLVTEQWKEFPRMNGLSGYKRGHIFAMRGRLSMLCCVDDVCDVWILKQQDNWNSWEKSVTVKVISCNGLPYISETGQCAVGCDERLKVVDLFEEAGEQYQGETTFPGPICNVMSYFESLISPSSIASGSRQACEHLNHWHATLPTLESLACDPFIDSIENFWKNVEGYLG